MSSQTRAVVSYRCISFIISRCEKLFQGWQCPFVDADLSLIQPLYPLRRSSDACGRMRSSAYGCENYAMWRLRKLWEPSYVEFVKRNQNGLGCTSIPGPIHAKLAGRKTRRQVSSMSSSIVFRFLSWAVICGSQCILRCIFLRFCYRHAN